MGISIEVSATSSSVTQALFETVIDLRCWTEHIGVRVRGPARPMVLGDEVDVAISVAGRSIGATCVVELIDPNPARLTMRTIAGALDGELVGSIVEHGGASLLQVALRGRGRGPVRLIEKPLELVVRPWVVHQVDHLIRTAER